MVRGMLRGVLLGLFLTAGVENALQAAPAKPVPDVETFLQILNLPTQYWHKAAQYTGRSSDGLEHWVISVAETPHRGDDNGCMTRQTYWSFTRDGKNKVNLDNDPDAGPNPEKSRLLNFDPGKRAVACDQIDYSEYIVVDEGISAHQAYLIMNELKNAVECVKQGRTVCPPWQKMDVPEGYKRDFLKLDSLRLDMMMWEDRDETPRNTIDVQYVLHPFDGRDLIYLDAWVRLMPDASMNLEIGEGEPDWVKED